VALLLQVKHSAARYGLSLKVATRSAQGKLSVPVLESPRPAASGTSREPEPDRRAPGSIWLSAANLLPQLIVIVDVDGFVRAGNRAAAQVLGVSCDRMVGRPIQDLLAAVAPEPEVTASLRRAYVMPFSFTLDLHGQVGDGRWAFDCRRFIYEGRPQLAIFGRPADLAQAGEDQQSD